LFEIKPAHHCFLSARAFVSRLQ